MAWEEAVQKLEGAAAPSNKSSGTHTWDCEQAGRVKDALG